MGGLPSEGRFDQSERMLIREGHRRKGPLRLTVAASARDSAVLRVRACGCFPVASPAIMSASPHCRTLVGSRDKKPNKLGAMRPKLEVAGSPERGRRQGDLSDDRAKGLRQPEARLPGSGKGRGERFASPWCTGQSAAHEGPTQATARGRH